MSGRVITRVQAEFQPEALCEKDGCGWSSPHSVRTREAAKRHVRTTGHDVRVVAEKVTLYGRSAS